MSAPMLRPVVPGQGSVQAPTTTAAAPADQKKAEENPKAGAILTPVLIGGLTTTGVALAETWVTTEAVKSAATAAAAAVVRTGDAAKDAAAIAAAAQKATLDTLMISAVIKEAGGITIGAVTAWKVHNPLAAWFLYGVAFGSMASGGYDLFAWNAIKNPG